MRRAGTPSPTARSRHRSASPSRSRCNAIRRSLDDSLVSRTRWKGLKGMGSWWIPFQDIISISCGFILSICSHRTVIRSSQMKTQFFVLKWVENHGETAIRLSVPSFTNLLSKNRKK